MSSARKPSPDDACVAITTLRMHAAGRASTESTAAAGSTVSSPIFACRSRSVAWCSDWRDALPPPKTSSNPSMACRFQVLTWFGWTSCRAAISCTVRSPRNASSATRFLKSAVNRRRRLVAIPVLPEGSGLHLSRLSENAGPPQLLSRRDDLGVDFLWVARVWRRGTHVRRGDRQRDHLPRQQQAAPGVSPSLADERPAPALPRQQPRAAVVPSSTLSR